MIETLLLLLVLAVNGVQPTFYGHDYYNDRYSGQGIAYTDSEHSLSLHLLQSNSTLKKQRGTLQKVN